MHNNTVLLTALLFIVGATITVSGSQNIWTESANDPNNVIESEDSTLPAIVRKKRGIFIPWAFPNCIVPIFDKFGSCCPAPPLFPPLALKVCAASNALITIGGIFAAISAFILGKPAPTGIQAGPVCYVECVFRTQNLITSANNVDVAALKARYLAAVPAIWQPVVNNAFTACAPPPPPADPATTSYNSLAAAVAALTAAAAADPTNTNTAAALTAATAALATAALSTTTTTTTASPANQPCPVQAAAIMTCVRQFLVTNCPSTLVVKNPFCTALQNELATCNPFSKFNVLASLG